MKILNIFLTLMLPLQLFSQSKIIGEIANAENNKVIGATIMLLDLKTSFLKHFTRTDRNGIFKIDGILDSRFIILVSNTGYIDYSDTITLKENSDITDLGKITIYSKSKMLENVTIKGRKRYAIRVLGDTTEFNADSFRVHPNAKVEDLFKQLPGIRVDSKGTITAYGEHVKEVLVDGEEFFGNDPLLVTRNLRADMVDKVQLFNRRSDRSIFSGIEDDQKTKTINIEIKKDKKNLLFGKINAGTGDNKFYNLNGVVNRFSETFKLSGFGVISNTGNVDYNLTDNAGNLTYNGKGLPYASGAGLHFDNKWNNDKNKFNGNYKFKNLVVKGINESINQNNLPDRVINTIAQEEFHNNGSTNQIDANFDMQKNGIPFFEVKLRGAINHNENASNYSQYSKNQNGSLLNSNSRMSTSIQDAKDIDIEYLWQHKFKKDRRSFSLNVIQSHTQLKANGQLMSKSQFFKDSTTSSQSFDQIKKDYGRGNNIKMNATFTEPLSHSSNLLIDYGITLNNSLLLKQTYENLPDQQYFALDSIFSGNYRFNQFSQQTGAYYNIKKNRISLVMGGVIGYSRYDQGDLFVHSSIIRQFAIINPNARLSYRISPSHWIKFSYNGNNIHPKIEQIQPIIDNLNPTRVYIGNPYLKPSFENKFSLDYMNAKNSAGRTLLLNSSISPVSNPIVVNVNTDQTGQDTLSFANFKGKKFITFNGFLLYSKLIQPLNLTTTAQFYLNGSRYVNLANSIPNGTNEIAYSFYAGLSKSIPEIYDFSINNNLSYNTLKNSLQIKNNNYWSNVFSTDLTIYIVKRLQLYSDINYNYRGKTNLFQGLQFFIWNASIGYSVLKNKGLLIKISANDLLNQNVGYERFALNNMITQNTYNTIARYYMFSVIWDFNKHKKND